MQLVKCEHPEFIRNKVTGLIETVPCGHCDLCRNQRASQWVTRLDIEAKSWPYVVFFTLTYDDNHIPKCLLQSDHSLVDPWSSLYLSPLFYDSLDAESKKLVRKSKGVRYASVRDFQLFIKRLRCHFDNITKPTINEAKTKKVREDNICRYFAVSEYGPTSLRPHFHGLLFFRSSRCFAQIDEIISQSWKNGIVDCSSVKSSASNYVARYVNSFGNLPKVYQLKPFRPFSLSSKCPPIGSAYLTDTQVKQIFDCGTTSLRLPHNTDYVDVPLFGWLKGRLFPKLQGFNNLSHSQRVACYGAYKFSGAKTLGEFIAWYTKLCDECDLSRVKGSFQNYVEGLYDRLNRDPWHLVRRYYYISKRVCDMASYFGISVDKYVSHIERYYNNVEHDQLVNLYKEQERQGRFYGNVRHFIFMDGFFIKSFLQFERFDDIPLSYYYAFDSYGVDIHKFYYDANYRRSLNPYRFRESLDYIFKVKKIVNDTHKTKARKEYLQLHPDCRIL